MSDYFFYAGHSEEQEISTNVFWFAQAWRQVDQGIEVTFAQAF